MVIQRWQSLFLLIAVILVAIFCCTPYAQIAAVDAAMEPSKIFVYNAPVYLILNIVIATLLFISIFMFKNLKMQIKVTKISLVLIAASIVTCCFMLYNGMPDAKLIWFGGIMLLVIAMIFTFMGMRFMQKDQKLLKSYDRLR